MDGSRKASCSKRHYDARRGFLFLGAVREVLMVGLAVVFITSIFCYSNSSVHLRSSSEENSEESFEQHRPVSNITLNRDRNSLIVHNWPSDISEISLVSGESTPVRTPHSLVSVSASERNSTIAMLSMWPQGWEIYFCVSIMRNGEFVCSEEFMTGTVESETVHVSSDGSFVAFINGTGEVIGWDLSEEEPIQTQFHVGRSCHIRGLSSNGSSILIDGASGKHLICDSRTGQVKFDLNDIKRRSRSADWSENGSRLAVGDESGMLHVFDVTTGTRIWHEQLELCFATSLIMSNDGSQIAAGGFDHKIRVWNVNDPTAGPMVLEGQSGVIRGLAFMPNDQSLISGSFNGTIREWSLSNGETIRQFR